MLQHSGQPDRSGTVNQYHPATQISPAGFQQDRGIQQDDSAAGMSLRRINSGLNPSSDLRVHNSFQLSAGGQELGSIAEDLSGERLAINLSLDVKNLLAEPLA